MRPGQSSKRRRSLMEFFGPMGWLAVTIYALLTLGYLYFQLQPVKRAA